MYVDLLSEIPYIKIEVIYLCGCFKFFQRTYVSIEMNLDYLRKRLQIKQDFTALILVHLNVENGALRLIISRKLQMHLE